jgi:maleylacetate reductase
MIAGIEVFGMRSFTYNMNAGRVLFGAGTLADLKSEVERLGLNRVLVLATPHQEKEALELAQHIGARASAVFSDARMHTPFEVTTAAMSVVRERGIDGIVAVGGGSTTGLAKAIALRTDLPQIVVPTTYAGSEMIPILGETENGKKVTRSDSKALPKVVIYDVNLTLTLPIVLSVTSGINAVAHAVEALYARGANPVISLMAEEAIRVMARALPRIFEKADDIDARADALYAAWLAGICLGSVGMALHHKLCHTLGGMFNLPHAETHTAILPHALAFNSPAIPEAIMRIGRALESDDLSDALFVLPASLGAEMSLSGLGMPAEGIESAVTAALSNPYWNPRPLDAASLRALLCNARDGAKPVRADT